MSQPTRDLPALQVAYSDDPRVVREAATEDYSLHVVPNSWRLSRGSLTMAWYALVSAMFFLVVAGTVALAVGTVDALIGIGLSVAVYGVINFFISRYAGETGLTVALFSRSMFGFVGAAIASLIFAATAIYYMVFEGSIVAVAFHEYLGALPLKLWYLVVVLYSVPLVWKGVRVWLDRFNGYLLPFYAIGLIAAVVWTIAEHGYDPAWLTYEPKSTAGIAGPGWLFAFTAYMGVWILMMYTMDYARLGRREDRPFTSTVTFGPVYYVLAFLVNGVIGIFLAQSIPTQDALTEISAVLGIVSVMGFAGVLLIWVSQTRINTANLYLASTNLQSFFSRVFKLTLPRTAWVVVAGAIAYLLMLTNVFNFILDALRYQGVLVVAWVGIALTHIAYTRVRGLELEFRPGRVPAFNPGGVAAWLVASAAGIVLVDFGGAFGATWSAPIAAVLAAVIYAVSLEFSRDSWFRMRRPYDPRLEVDDMWEARVRCGTCEKSYIAVEMDRHPGASHEPICASCATGAHFYLEARKEAREETTEHAVPAPEPVHV